MNEFIQAHFLRWPTDYLMNNHQSGPANTLLRRPILFIERRMQNCTCVLQWLMGGRFLHPMLSHGQEILRRSRMIASMVVTSNEITRWLADCIFNCVVDDIGIAYRALNVLVMSENHGHKYQVAVKIFMSTLDYIESTAIIAVLTYPMSLSDISVWMAGMLIKFSNASSSDHTSLLSAAPFFEAQRL